MGNVPTLLVDTVIENFTSRGLARLGSLCMTISRGATVLIDGYVRAHLIPNAKDLAVRGQILRLAHDDIRSRVYTTPAVPVSILVVTNSRGSVT